MRKTHNFLVELTFTIIGEWSNIILQQPALMITMKIELSMSFCWCCDLFYFCLAVFLLGLYVCVCVNFVESKNNEVSAGKITAQNDKSSYIYIANFHCEFIVSSCVSHTTLVLCVIKPFEF